MRPRKVLGRSAGFTQTSISHGKRRGNKRPAGWKRVARRYRKVERIVDDVGNPTKTCKGFMQKHSWGSWPVAEMWEKAETHRPGNSRKGECTRQDASPAKRASRAAKEKRFKY